MKFSLRQLAVFVEVARYQSISRAAEALHLSQSATSEALIKLEKSYQAKLFHRVNNTLVLSPLGSSLRAEAENLLARCSLLEDKLRGQQTRGDISISASFTIGNHLAPRYLAKYLEVFPQAKVALNTANSPEVIAQVRNQDVDIGIIEVDVADSDLTILPWRTDEMVVFCSAQHSLAQRRKLRPKDMREARWILREAGSGARQTFERALAQRLADINIYMEFKHNEAIKRAVESGLGIGCLSRIVLERDLAHGDLVELEVSGIQLQRRFHFALPRGREMTAAIQQWIDICQLDAAT